MKSLVKYVFSIIPFKKQLFTLLKSIWNPPEEIYQHLYFKDIFTIKVDERITFKMRHYGFQLENQIFWKGLRNGWEKESIKLWIELCKHSNVIFDIGANTGVYALIAKAVNPNSNVYAFEPVSRVYEKLKDNIALNGYNIQAFDSAVSNYDGEAVIFDLPTEHVYSVTVNKNLSTEVPTIETKVTTVRLDTFIESNQIPHVDLIKIDVETHEPEVLEGYTYFIQRHRPNILIEILNDEVAARLSTLVDGLDYVYFNIDERGAIQQAVQLQRSDYYNFLLCSKETAMNLDLLERPK